MLRGLGARADLRPHPPFASLESAPYTGLIADPRLTLMVVLNFEDGIGQDVGPKRVNKVPAYLFTGKIVFPAGELTSCGKTVTRKDLAASDVPNRYELYLDGEGMPARIVLRGKKISLTTDFRDWGSPVTIVAPN